MAQASSVEAPPYFLPMRGSVGGLLLSPPYDLGLHGSVGNPWLAALMARIKTGNALLLEPLPPARDGRSDLIQTIKSRSGLAPTIGHFLRLPGRPAHLNGA
jgi:hypothetical protein